MNPEQTAQLVAAIITFLVAAAGFLQSRKAAKAAEDGKQAATSAKHAASAAESTSNGRLSEQIKFNQELQRENYYLRRLIDALEMDPKGLDALAIARARLETLRVLRPGEDRS